VFILKTLPGTEKALKLKRGEIGVRIPGHPVPLALIRSLGSPLYSVTAKRSMEVGNLPVEEAEPGGHAEELSPIPEEELFEGGWELETVEGLDLILDSGDDRPRIFSTILDLSGNEIKLLRLGEGPWPA
jgi:tRNA A37 threonylcarbamoyladenosine synthetase subunit TsaC/SUA5/YrdC